MKFKFPPINELVIGVYFNTPLLNLRAEHIGLFWHRIRDAFPRANQAGPIVAQGEAFQAVLVPAPEEIYPLPRFWFSSADETMLVQLQRNAFLLNWRKRDQMYPHYETVKREFDRVYGIFAEFVREIVRQDFAIEAAELTYINLAEAGEYWSGVNDIARVIPTFRPVEIDIEGATLADASQSTAWTVAKDISVTAKLQTGTMTADKRPALVFELSAKCRLGAATKAEADAWFERAHEVTGRAFRGMTSPEIQASVWKPQEPGAS
jgi:uncharacterized protein (TIGR04255 family)